MTLRAVELNSDGELVLPANWLADMLEADWLDDINTTIQDFDEQRAATADSLSDLMKLNHDDRAWLTAALANGGSVRTHVFAETAAIDEESMFGAREVIGNRPYGNLHIRVFGGEDDVDGDLGEFELPGSWPEAEFNPDGKSGARTMP